MESEKVFLRIKSISDRRIICGVLAENGYSVRFGQKKKPGKKSTDYGVIIEEKKEPTENES